MIKTFQMITLFGTGDPKMMASGISEALVTTMLGLCVAIPLVLLHAAVANTSKSVTEIIEEQAAGLIARRIENRDASA
jgi:biopolymer transport protein ExbB